MYLDQAAVGLFTRINETRKSAESIVLSDLYGSRESKYSRIMESSAGSLPAVLLRPNTPFYLFVEQDQTHRREYDAMLPLTEVMPTHSVGVVTARDSLTIAFTPEEMWDRVQRFSELSESDARSEFNLRPDVRDWKVSYA